VIFTEAEEEALRRLAKDGGLLITSIPDKNERDPVFRTIEPGIRVYQKIEKQGLVVITEEEPIEDLDGFCFTPSVELTDEGLKAAQKL